MARSSLALAFRLLPILAGFPLETNAAPPSVIVRPAGPVETLYNWSKDRCEDEFIPDAPARAIRRANGEIMLIATHRENWSLTGPNFRNLKPVCKSNLRSSEVGPRIGTGLLWIQALFTENGRDVVALISEDRQAISIKSGCDAKKGPGSCWLNNILTAQSHDMGRTFHLNDAPDRTVVALESAYPKQAQGRFGAFTTSNIVKNGNGYYVFVWVQAEDLQPQGNCLFRTENPFLPHGWKAWDGISFSVPMSDPAMPHACVPVKGLPNEVRSLTFDTKNKVWIAVLSARQKLSGDAKPVPGFHYSTSFDLINWSDLDRIMPAPLVPREEQKDYFYMYPSMIDPKSRSINFDTLESSTPVLTFTNYHLMDGKGSMNRDLSFVPLTVVAASPKR